MKYSEKNKPLVCMQTTSRCYRNTTTMTVKGVLWHSTGANNPTLKRYVQPSDNAADREEMLKILGKNTYGNDWNHVEKSVGLNCWIGKLADGTVTTVQTMPWNYRPWGCGAGSRGSCNNGWIQFEICESDLNDKNYFDKVYKEACEITAYLCDMFNLDPNGTVNYNGIKVPVILCHGDSADLGLGSEHVDINHWFPKHGKSMKTARADVAALMGNKKPAEPAPAPAEPASRKFKNGDAVQLVSGATYSNGGKIPAWVFDSKLYVRGYNSNTDVVISTLTSGDVTGVVKENNLVAYTATNTAPVAEIKKGDKVKLKTGAKYFNGQTIPSWVFKETLYAREIRSNGQVVISTQPTGAITGVVYKQDLTSVEAEKILYKASVTCAVLNIRKSASTSSAIVGQLKQNEVCDIYEEKNGWGRMKYGWISLSYTKKV